MKKNCWKTFSFCAFRCVFSVVVWLKVPWSMIVPEKGFFQSMMIIMSLSVNMWLVVCNIINWYLVIDNWYIRKCIFLFVYCRSQQIFQIKNENIYLIQSENCYRKEEWHRRMVVGWYFFVIIATQKHNSGVQFVLWDLLFISSVIIVHVMIIILIWR